MSANPHKPHLLILPEDQKDHEIAKGFEMRLNTRQYQVMPLAGGWGKVVKEFLSTYSATMKKYPDRYFILIIDFDGQYEARYDLIFNQIPEDIRERIFLLGVSTEPDDLQSQLGHIRPSAIGELLAEDCREDHLSGTWAHPLLKHNLPEIARMPAAVRAILFGG